MDGDACDLRLRSPIIVVALEHDARVQFVFGELIGTGADGAFQKIVEALAFNVVLGNDIAAEERQPLRHGRRRRTEFHRCLGRRLDDNVVHLSHGIGDVELEAGFVAFKERVAEILGRHLAAVVERHVVAQLDRHAQSVGRQSPGLDQMRDQLEMRILIERLVEHGLEDRLRIRRESLIRIPGGHVVRPSDGGGVVGGSKRTGKRRRGADGRGCSHDKLQERPSLQLKRHGVRSSCPASDKLRL